MRSHPAALDQCRRLLAAMPWATAIAAATTADAASEVAEQGDPTEAAIASERAARMYGLSRHRRRRRRPSRGVHALRLGRAVHAARPRERDAGAPRSRSSPTTGRAPCTGRSSRSAAIGSTSSSSSRARSRTTPWRYRFDAVLAGHPLDPIVARDARRGCGARRASCAFSARIRPTLRAWTIGWLHRAGGRRSARPELH